MKMKKRKRKVKKVKMKCAMLQIITMIRVTLQKEF